MGKHGQDGPTWLGGMMKSRRFDDALDDIAELEEAEFALSFSPCRRIEDFNDIGDLGDSFSIGAIAAGELSCETDWL
jgi:hypothetical protein